MKSFIIIGLVLMSLFAEAAKKSLSEFEQDRVDCGRILFSFFHANSKAEVTQMMSQANIPLRTEEGKKCWNLILNSIKSNLENNNCNRSTSGELKKGCIRSSLSQINCFNVIKN